MPQKIKNYLTIILSIFAITLPVLLPATSLAATCDNITTNINSGVNEATGNTQSCGATDISTGVKNIAVTVVNILSIVVGIVAVIMIIYGGFRYITSGGESGNVSGAKNTLLFAIVGLVIVALAQVIVRWVIGTSSNIGTGNSVGGFIHF
ncbi:MAG: hypothetical protein ACREF7_04195 [Candidatus Saccharimonadales bacterium]